VLWQLVQLLREAVESRKMVHLVSRDLAWGHEDGFMDLYYVVPALPPRRHSEDDLVFPPGAERIRRGTIQRNRCMADAGAVVFAAKPKYSWSTR
jgi:hypothetical protein